MEETIETPEGDPTVRLIEDIETKLDNGETDELRVELPVMLEDWRREIVLRTLQRVEEREGDSR
ncbi:hypothetical protein [Haloarchaeobius litoreus]|uniref:Uncharacterized protein n=1 Tax=Haloarchaeobius litoreus TaxID=755306 RepID=A0ABD6DK58_9EURY|nr:hypothetical protein [Haloarchaeobius litoreus]